MSGNERDVIVEHLFRLTRKYISRETSKICYICNIFTCFWIINIKMSINGLVESSKGQKPAYKDWKISLSFKHYPQSYPQFSKKPLFKVICWKYDLGEQVDKRFIKKCLWDFDMTFMRQVFFFKAFLVRVERIELSPHPWQGRVLPLNDTRNGINIH